ncbi:MAG: murein biosynthesis integral membrane protein MurJ [Acidimicrobiia bacterium]
MTVPEQPDPPGRSLYRRMGIAAAIVGGGVLLSRILGLVRQVVFAAIIGPGAEGDAYFVAFLIPDLLNYLLAGAYMAITLIPILTRRFAVGNDEDAWRAFWAVTRPLAIGMTALVVVAMPLVPAVLRLVEPGFDEAQIAEATRLTRIVLPAQVFFILGQLFTAVQFARERFLIPALGPIVYNLAIIGGGLVGALGSSRPTADGFAWGAVVGAFLGIFVLQVWGARRVGLRFPAGGIRRHPAVRRYFALAIPLMLGQSLVVLDEQFGRAFGSLHGDGGVSWLSFGRQTMLVPVGVIAQAAGVAAYPFLARLAAEGKHRELAAAVGRAIRYVVVFSLASAAALIALSEPVVRVLYERGSFGPSDTIATAATVVLFGIGVPMWGIQQILARGFFAREQMWPPVILGTVATIVALPVYWWLNRSMGLSGLALASSIAITVYTALLAVEWYRRTGTEELRPVMRTTLRNLPLAAVAGLLTWVTASAILSSLGSEGFWQSAAAVVGGGLVTGAITLLPPPVRRDLHNG